MRVPCGKWRTLQERKPRKTKGGRNAAGTARERREKTGTILA